MPASNLAKALDTWALRALRRDLTIVAPTAATKPPTENKANIPTNGVAPIFSAVAVLSAVSEYMRLYGATVSHGAPAVVGACVGHGVVVGSGVVVGLGVVVVTTRQHSLMEHKSFPAHMIVFG